MKFRTGIGFDVHQFGPDRELWLGGIRVPYEFGLVGHSDADVLIHAVCDALLGAAHLKDIGYHFPDTDGAYKNIDSKILLKKCAGLLADKGFKISNVDSIICAQAPKMKPYIDQMQSCMASVLGIDEEDVTVKATTTEHLGFVGRKEGISAYATVLIYKE
ncbi:MAG: 2-C-methyl-D-erythritol 2,4-cyclodiphosphate synthase [Paludibacteraceae bacterium]|nr:2-C-methyl-D-erythritol 2,4-cyclodiphosphate synthase [Paludibacteraceae bacterium]MBR6105226.1 2-C-methyl-D-erythritol 2,4-cyclodiphosphate synthase [Paludibacteraceae bacterium]